MTHTLTGQIVLPDRLLPGTIRFDSHIREIESGTTKEPLYILPGFIDGHIHGGDGADTMDASRPSGSSHNTICAMVQRPFFPPPSHDHGKMSFWH